MNDFAPIDGTLVIGIGHKARHGKDTAARILIEAFPRDVQRFSFADALYADCRINCGMTRKDGPLLQRHGVARRAVDPNVWINAVYWSIVDKAPRVAVITDVRFENEGAFVKALGGVTVKVERRDGDGRLFVVSDRDPNHISETALDDYPWDYVIENPEGRPEIFRARVLDAFLALTQRTQVA